MLDVLCVSNLSVFDKMLVLFTTKKKQHACSRGNAHFFGGEPFKCVFRYPFAEFITSSKKYFNDCVQTNANRVH